MSSVTFTRASIAPVVGANGTMSSNTSNDRRVPAKEISTNMFNGSSGTGKSPYRHIDDLVSVGVDLDPHTPLRKILELGDAHMRQATTYSDFRRPDLALQEYIKAFTIAVDKVPRHKDYPSMSSDRGDLNRLYKALKMKITTNGAIFDKIKEEIKEDNRRSGVQPTISSKRSFELARLNWPNPSSTPQQVQANHSMGPQSNGLKNELEALNRGDITDDTGGNAAGGRRPKPMIQPKPQALHGRAIKQTQKDSPEDLANRFARLRATQKSRNATKALDQAQSAVTEESTPSQTLPLVDTSILTMPKLPEAIYSPARGTVTSEIANLPSSTPRGMFSRTNSITSAPSVLARISTENAIRAFSREQFVAAHSYRVPQPSATLTEFQIPDGDDITAETLAGLLNQYPQIDVLVIDVRDRESFDEGHIKSVKTICIEPEILMRENISADEIADSMVLAPPSERLAVEQRDKVDLVVIYDQNSASISSRITGDSLEMVLYNIRQALSYYSYSRPLKRAPKLLRGGLNSWVQEFGEQSLETSETTSNYVSPSSASRHGYGDRRRTRTKTKTLNQDEISQFEDMIKNDQMGLDNFDNFDYVKTREDFIRRYPSIIGDPESMTSVKGDLDSQEDFLVSIAPTPPKLPAPAIPRTRYSGLESMDDDSSVGGIAMTATRQRALADWPADNQLLTGLRNLGNTCYCNSTIQVLLASHGFIGGILEERWPQDWRQAGDKEPTSPQLLSKILKTTLMWLYQKRLKDAVPTALLKYMRSVHTGYYVNPGNRLVRLGDDNQHDTDELFSFMFDEIAAETNVSQRFFQAMNNVAIPPNTRDDVAALVDQYRQQWRISLPHNFIDTHWSVFTLVERKCDACGNRTFQRDSNRCLIVTPPDTTKSRSPNQVLKLEDLLHREYGSEKLEMTCGNKACGHKHAQSTSRLAKLPRLLRVHIRRATGGNEKVLTQVSFPLELDLQPWSCDESVRAEAGKILGINFHDGLVCPTQYELYAIQCHIGTNTNSGHYWCWLKDQQKDTWIHCNDTTITLYSGRAWRAELEKMYKCSKRETPVQLYYKRRDILYTWEEEK
ncbi:cysteine proteinase [Daldinia vernicosa]|uniref:cysteine proteinase n=1 Tax=Daldinia vernicosa TaxID=114800 RepID=UPI0020079532|nr:cysteine proteinase [Daldinia vernicosa]KAI0849847.1 cysteine proteinase [Daldinia vernicosa]